jgi:hypothetical protein
MKKLTSTSFGKLIFLLGMFLTTQFSFGDILIRKDDPAPGTVPMGVTSLSATSLTTTSTSTYTTYPVSADVIGTDLIVDFSKSVGIAYITVVDYSGAVVYMTAADTSSSREVVIPVDGWSSGKYSVKIAYKKTKLIGDFWL